MQAQVATRPVLRIFISSTAVDLTDYRESVRDAVLSLQGLPIAMETFSAMSGRPAGECMKMAAEADGVICIVAHRYGYVPPREFGGDGERSITWLEVDAAKKAGKPVFAFLVDPKAPWTALKEQDRLVAEPEKAAEIVKAVQKLQEFKAFLEREQTRKTFKNKDDLAAAVTASLANFAPQPGQVPTSTSRVWQPLFCHALQPAQHFRGRQGTLRVLEDWLQSPVTPDRVVSLVAMGGTGKTALVDKAMREAKLSDRAGVFAWSFYEDPDTDKFLRAAYLYFTGEKDAPAAGMLERLQIALSGDLPHLLILDGLERVQSEGDQRRRGELDDSQLKRLVRAIAGGVGNARALVTSRFPLVDLDAWANAGHRPIPLDDLERAAAIDILKAWKVTGDDSTLTKLLEPLNINDLYHALSVDVLGSYIGNFAGGDPTRGPDFSLEDAKEADPKARRLSRILEQYAKALTSPERDLLSRLSLFPRGVKVEILGWIVQAGGNVAGTLVGFNQQQIVGQLERLRQLGLVFRSRTAQNAVYSAHPFLREFFRNLLGTSPETVHESVRARLAPSLDVRPGTSPMEQTVLDQYELLIEETLLSGHIEQAFDLYWFGLNAYDTLGKTLGDYGRGLRIIERFFPGDQFDQIRDLSLRQQSLLINDLGLYARNLGDIDRARQALTHCASLAARESDDWNGSISYQNLADGEICAGHFPRALEYSENAVSLAAEDVNERELKDAIADKAISQFALGRVSEATAGFQRATELEHAVLFQLRGVQEAECKLLSGRRSSALSQTISNRNAEANSNATLCRCDALLAWLLAREDAALASHHLEEARKFATHSGHVELQLRCFQAASELQRALGDHPQSIAEAEAGILLADGCRFGKYSIELRLALAEALLAAGDARKALMSAREALDRSEHPECQYAWGRADGLHFCGIAHVRLGERELARQRLTAALELRERLGHGRIEETRRALADLGLASHA